MESINCHQAGEWREFAFLFCTAFSIVVISVFPQNHSGNRNWNNTCVFSSFWPMLSRMGAACWLSTAWAAYATFSEAVQRCHQHTGKNFRKRNTLRSSLDFCAKKKKIRPGPWPPCCFHSNQAKQKWAHPICIFRTQYPLTGQLRGPTQLRPNCWVLDPIPNYLLGQWRFLPTLLALLF